MSLTPRATRLSSQGRGTSTEASTNPFKTPEEAARFLQSQGYTEVTKRATEYDIALMIEQVGVALSDLRDARMQVKSLYAIASCLRTKTHASTITELSALWNREPHNGEEAEEKGRQEQEERKETRDLMKKLIETTEASSKASSDAIKELATSVNSALEKLITPPPHPAPPIAPELNPPAQPTYAQAARTQTTHHHTGQPTPAVPNPPPPPPPQLAHRHIARCQVQSMTGISDTPPISDRWLTSYK